MVLSPTKTSAAIRVALLCVCVVVAQPLWAQYTVGRVEGAILDQSGALLGGATVTLANQGTNAVRSFTTASDGRYFFFALPPGDYVLSAAAKNFNTRAVRLTVRTSETVTQNLSLELGRTATTVEVTAEAQLVASDAQRDTTRTELELANLPSLGRNMISTVQLGAGISPTNNPRGGSTFGGGGSFVIVLGVQSGLISANGGRARATSVQLDYTDANDWEGGGFAPGMQAITPDMLQEFKILSSNFSAEYGVKSNAQVIMVTKSGSNTFHGSAYDFLQNDAFNARDYFDQTGKASPLKQNVYGITAGGAIIKDRTFLFAGYEGRKTRGGSLTTLASVPSLAARGSVTDPNIQGLIERFLPLPTGATKDPLVGTIPVQIPSPVDNYLFVAKADHQLTRAHMLSLRYLQGTASFVARFTSKNQLPGFDQDNHFELRNANITDSWTISPRSVNELRLGYGRSLAQGNPQNGLQTPRFLVNGLVNFGALETAPSARIFNVFQVNEVLSHVHGGHVLRLGGDVRKIQDNSDSATNVRGVFTFASTSQFLNAQPSQWTELFGGTRRAFRTGLYAMFLQDDWKVRPTLTINAGLRWEIQGALSEADDSTSILSALYPGPIGAAGSGPLGAFSVGPTAVNGNPANFAPRIGFAWNPRGGSLVVRGGYGIYWDSFTFSPMAASRAVPPLNYSVTLTGAKITGANSLANLLNGTAPIIASTQAQVGGFGALKNFGGITTIDPNLPNPYVQQFSLGVETRLPAKMVFSAAYVGAKGTQLTRMVAINPLANPPAPATSTANELARMSALQAVAAAENGPGNLRLDPRFDQVNLQEAGGSSIYHSLQAELKKSLSHGVQFQASYTWSKSIDNASDFSPTIQANDNGFAQDFTNLRAERAVSNFDITHRVLVTAIWQMRFFHHLQSWPRKLLDGWSFESVNMWQSGIPATLLSGSRTLPVLDGTGSPVIDPVTHKPKTVSFADVNLDGNLIPTGADNTRANCAPGGSFAFGSPSQTYGFSQPLLGNNGTCGRNTIRMNSLLNFDWSLFKETTLRESGVLGSAPLTLQLRMEAYNVFNIPFLTAQGDNWRTVSSSSFAAYNAAGSTRRMQFAVRLGW